LSEDMSNAAAAGPIATNWLPGEPDEMRDENRPLLKRLNKLIKKGRQDEVRAIVVDWPPAHIMELLIQLPLQRARRLFGWLPIGLAAKVLTAVNPALRSILTAEAGIARVAEIAGGMRDDDVVALLNELPEEARADLLDRLPRSDVLRYRLAFDADSAGTVMSNRFVAVAADWPIGLALRQIRRSAADIEKLYEVYVVDEDRRLAGLLKLRDLILSPKKTLVREVMRPAPAGVDAEADQEEVLELAERFGLQTIPVLDQARRIIGRVTLDELRDVVRREAEEDIMLMSGVATDSRADESLFKLVKGRLPWLMAGLVGSSVAATVVGSYEAELEQAAILASFIPVTMAMAGNAGIQASTVTVQGLANGTLWIGDLRPRLLKEVVGALINGAAVASVLSCLILLASLVFDIESPIRLALSAAAALTCVTVIAATLGSTIPLLLNRLKIDPAVATGVFITSSNDIFGVLIYFLMATMIYFGA